MPELRRFNVYIDQRGEIKGAMHQGVFGRLAPRIDLERIEAVAIPDLAEWLREQIRDGLPQHRAALQSVLDKLEGSD